VTATTLLWRTLRNTETKILFQDAFFRPPQQIIGLSSAQTFHRRDAELISGGYTRQNLVGIDLNSGADNSREVVFYVNGFFIKSDKRCAEFGTQESIVAI
jgi:hypothetical protein